MTHLDPEGERLLRRLADERPDAYGDVEPATGEDSDATISLTIDAAKRIIEARVLDADRVRRPAAFVAALRDAFVAADGDRLFNVLVSSGDVPDWIARADGAADDTPRRRGRLDLLSSGTAIPQRSSSAGGHLSVQRSERGDLIDVDVDADWLAAAEPEELEVAIVAATRYAFSTIRLVGAEETRDDATNGATDETPNRTGIRDELAEARGRRRQNAQHGRTVEGARGEPDLSGRAGQPHDPSDN
ncbi:hypothetical protein KG112_09600 [Nocardioides sp. zg-ZUI104]|uniref:hypothetical protein n=1 Tax=Nocardioides faecalis TaxID=2803858 RepID=UPI001BCF25B2|nr:hypothetical protein [Nocardioides faecalis]MBS4753057.1 hypothetical protein [Nocardioides faecalis]